MKTILVLLFLAVNLSTVCFAGNGLNLQNSINQQYFAVITNKNAETQLELPNDAIQPIPTDQVPDFSYFYNGQYSIMDLQCSISGNTSSSDIFIKYDNSNGIQSVGGECQIQLNGQTAYVMPMWDSNPHGTIFFNVSLKK